MQRLHWIYILKTWFSILFIAPLLSDLIIKLSRENSSKIGGLVDVFPITLMVGFLFSSPTFIILFLTDYFMIKNEKDVRDIKFTLVTLLTIGTISSFLIVYSSQDFEITFSYTLVALLSSTLFKLEKN